MSGVDFFHVEELNPYSKADNQPDATRTGNEYQNLINALQEAHIEVIRTNSPPHCQDGVYTANWALCRGNIAVMASLPNMRQGETPHAKQALANLGFEIVTLPGDIRFSGQGDALPCGDLLFTGTSYRTDAAAHQYITDILGYTVISLQTIPALDVAGKPLINKVTGWPDSFFYDIDLALSVIRPDLIAWCPDAFTPDSQAIIRNLSINKIEVSLDEAQNHFACNLVSTGEVVIMSNAAPNLQKAIESYGLKTITPNLTELPKGGGYIRCMTLALDNN